MQFSPVLGIPSFSMKRDTVDNLRLVFYKTFFLKYVQYLLF